MFRTILVAHDGTSSGDCALELALQLRHPDGRLVLLGVHTSARFMVDPRTAIPAGVEYRWKTIASPSVARTLTEAAAAESADLLVVGPSHRRRFGRALLRTTGQRALHGAPCALAVATRRPRQIERIGVAYDGSPESDLALEAAYGLANGLAASVALMCALEPLTLVEGGVAVPADPELEAASRFDAEDRLMAAAARAPAHVQVGWELLRGRAAEALPRFALQDADLMITGSRGHGPIRRVLLGSVSASLIAAGRVPTLVTPARAARGLSVAASSPSSDG